MKTVYIPKGETVSYESLVTEHLVVKGCLKVAYDIKAKTISGGGTICAGSVEADVVRIDGLEAASVICKRLIAKRVQAPEVFASESAVVSCFLAAACVKTGKLTAAISEIDEVEADEVVNLARKKRTLFGTLLVSALRSFGVSLTADKATDEVIDAEFTSVQDHEGINQPEKPADGETAASEAQAQPEHMAVASETAPADEELNRFIAIFKLLRESGYTLKVIPGTPEENAPAFDFETGTIIRPAA